MAETGFMQDDQLQAFMTVAMNYHNGNGEFDYRPFLIATLMDETGMRISEVLGEQYYYYTNSIGQKVSPKPTSEQAKELGYKSHKYVIGGLYIEDLDWTDQRLFIRRAKGNKSRYIPVSSVALSVVQAYLNHTGRTKNSKGKLIEGMTPKWLRKVFHRICREAGVSKIHPHLFRNTFAVRYLKRKGDIRVLQKVLGHSSLTVTAKYLKYTDRQVFEDYDRVMNQGGD
jgi:integrase